MKMDFEEPVLNVISFSVEDVLTSSFDNYGEEDWD